jgi:hypothetical protein
MLIKTVKELKDVISNLPDDMEVQGYDGSDRTCNISFWLHTKDTLSYEEINDGYNGVPPSIMIISTD